MHRPLFSVHILGLPHDTKQHELAELFAEAGKIQNVYIAGKSNGIDAKVHKCTYGFVRYSTMEECVTAVRLYNKWPFKTKHELKVTLAHDQPISNSVHHTAGDLTKLMKKLDPRSVEALKASLRRLDLEDEMPALVREVCSVDDGPVQQWAYPQEEIHLNFKALDSLTTQIEEMEKSKKTRVCSNTEIPAPRLNVLHETHESKSPQEEEQSEQKRFLRTGHASPSEHTDSQSYVIDCDKLTDIQSSHPSNLSKQGVAQSSLEVVDRPVYLGRGLGRSKLMKQSDRETKPGQRVPNVVPTGRGVAILEKFRKP